jgi:hypothetical protein
MRMFKRLLPALLVTILVAGLATAQAAGVAKTNRSPTAPEALFSPGCSQAPGQLRLDFGTVVRDTADEQRVGPGHWHVPRYGSLWNSLRTWNWFSLLIRR